MSNEIYLNERMATKLHTELSYRALTWMNSRMTESGKRWATEIMICPKIGWIADAAAFAYPQYRYYEQIKPKPEPTDWFLYIFESKISRKDYNKSFSGKYDTHKIQLIGNFHYIVTPKNLIKIDELPDGWGWLMQSGNGLREMHRPQYNPITESFKYQVGWRMLWTSYGYRSSIEDWELKHGQLF